MSRLACLIALASCLSVGCTADIPYDSTSSPIVDGVAENGYESVVFLFNRAGGACSAALVAPRAVLTARHCVESRGGFAQPRDLTVYVGPVAFRPERQYRVSEVRPLEGGGIRDGRDVAMLILATAAEETPLEISFDPPRELGGQYITGVGYGQTPSGQSGRKYRTRKLVRGIMGGFIFVEPTVCSGDSGSPLIGPDGRVWGVASFIFDSTGTAEPQCGLADGAYNAIEQHREFIEQVIVDSGSCIPGTEVCNGIDDDCDGELDEGCTPLGQPCAENDECVGGLCADTPEGRLCTQECDPVKPMIGCPPSMYCAAAGGCSGYCLEGQAGAGLIGSDCSSDTDCVSAACADPGDGRRRCLPPCIGNRGMCLAGEVCAAVSGSCGSCVDEYIVTGLRGFGESCGSDADCAEGECFADEGLEYCSRGCAEDGDCGEGFHCRIDICVSGPREAEGGGCVTNDDCAPGLACARLGDVRWCTRACGEGCPTGMMCDSASGVCAPSLAVVGEPCVSSDECLSALCAQTEQGSLCTRYCGPDRHCSPGFECIRVNGGLDGVCLAPPASSSGGCAIVEGSTPRRPIPKSMLWIVGVVGVLMLGRRRRRA